MSENTFNVENNKCICQEYFIVCHVTGSTYLRIIFGAYIQRYIQTLEGIGKIEFVSELTILLNL